MRKLRTRPPRFVSVDNRAVDDLRQGVLDVGLLTVALRCPDGYDFTVADLARKRRPGREALTKAMRTLVACGYVVKLKIQDAASGTWRTEFSVADMPFSQEDVAGMLQDVSRARAVRVEPVRLDPRTRPAVEELAEVVPGRGRDTGSRNSAATSTNAQDRQVGPTDGKPTAGNPTTGQPSAQKRTLEVQDWESEQDSLSSPSSAATPQGQAASGGAGGTGGPGATARQVERETLRASPLRGPGDVFAGNGPATAAVRLSAAAQPDVHAAGVRVADAWAAAREQRGFAVPVLGRTRVARCAAALLASGVKERDLVLAAADMARQANWLDLERHLEHWVPVAPAPSRPTQPVVFCGRCDYGWITDDDERVRKCSCRKPGPKG